MFGRGFRRPALNFWNGEKPMKKSGGTIASTVRALAEPIARNLGYDLWDVEYVKEGADYYLRIEIDSEQGITLDDCEKMVMAARRSGRKLMIDQNQRLAKAHRKARELVRDGFIGKILTFRTTFGHAGPETWSIDPGNATWFFDKKRAVMGVMADLGVHKTDLIQYILGQKVVATTARLTTLDKKDASGKPISVDDNAMCIYEMDGGAVGTMTASWTYYGQEDNSTILYGEKGILRIYDNPEYSLEAIMRNGERVLFDLDRIQTNDNQTSTGIVDSFIDCIKNDVRPSIDGEDVLNAMKAVLGSIESSRTGHRVELN